MVGHFLVADDIGDDSATADLKDAEDFLEQLPLRSTLYQVQDTVGNDDVDGIVRDERLFDAQLLRQLIRGQERSGIADWPPFQFRIEQIDAQGQVLDPAFAKLDVPVTNSFRHHGRVSPRYFQHLVRHVDSDNLATPANHLRRDETNLPGAAPQIE